MRLDPGSRPEHIIDWKVSSILFRISQKLLPLFPRPYPLFSLLFLQYLERKHSNIHLESLKYSSKNSRAHCVTAFRRLLASWRVAMNYPLPRKLTWFGACNVSRSDSVPVEHEKDFPSFNVGSADTVNCSTCSSEPQVLLALTILYTCTQHCTNNHHILQVIINAPNGCV